MAISSGFGALAHARAGRQGAVGCTGRRVTGEAEVERGEERPAESWLEATDAGGRRAPGAKRRRSRGGGCGAPDRRRARLCSVTACSIRLVSLLPARSNQRALVTT